MGPSLSVEGVERIAVLRANAIGDLVFALPALEALRAAYPDARLTLLGRNWHAPFLRGRGGPIDEVVAVPGSSDGESAPPADAPWLAADPSDLETFIRRTRELRPDLALQMHGGGKNSNPLVAELGARVTAGMHTPDAVPLMRSVPYVYYQQESARCLEVASLVGAEPVTLAPRLALTDADQVAADRVLDRSGPYAVLHAGATDPRRRWPPDRFARVGDVLAERGLRVVLTGTAAESPITAAVAAHMRTGPIDMAGRGDLRALLGILAGARLVVSNDTGPMHLAIAVGTPTVGIYWVGNLINGGPLTRAIHRPVLSWRTRCPACGVDCTTHRCGHVASFVDEAPLDEVLSAVDALLEAHVEPPLLAHALHGTGAKA